MFGAIAILTERYRRVKTVRDNTQFVRAFYARHRAILKSSYVAAQDNQSVIIRDPKDQWVNSAAILMTRFAQKHEIITDNPMELTAKVFRSLEAGTNKATALLTPLMPLMPDLEDVLIEDLNGRFVRYAPKAKAIVLVKDMLTPDSENSSAMSAAQ